MHQNGFVQLHEQNAPATSPLYVDRGGDLVAYQPFMHEQTHMRNFFLKGDREKLQALCDRIFNRPSDYTLNFQPLGSTVLLSFAQIKTIYSAHEHSPHAGSMPEIDVAFWIPMLSRRDGVLHLSWYVSYIFVDNPLAAAAGPLPVAVRLALRDLARYEDRSGAALAAISFALGIAAATIITASAAEHGDFEGNLSDRQILIRTGTGVGAEGENLGGPFVPERTPAEIESLEAGAGQLAVLLNDATLIAVDVALDPTMEPDTSFGFSGLPAITLSRPTSLGGRPGYMDVTLLYVATPELLAQYGIDLETLNPDTEVLTVESGELRFSSASNERGAQPEIVTNVEQIGPGYSSLPGSFITPDALRCRGWEPVRIGWLVEAGQPLTVEQLAAARELAASAGLTIESRDYQEGLSSLRTGATAGGMFLALGVLAMTVGLVRSAAAGDLRTLTATGATSGVRRALTAATAGTLALLGALLGTAGAYLALIAWYSNDLAPLLHVPVLNLLLIVAGIPLVAALAGWLTAGREPAMLARQPIE